jgi:hypothetical protein
VFDQIRDLESFIDDFVAENNDQEKTESENYTVYNETTIIDSYPDEKTEVTNSIIYEKPHEKTLIEEEEEKILVEEKVLVETPLPLSMLDYNLNLSDDFSSLVNQFKELTVSPIDSKPTPIKQEPIIKQDPVIISVSDSTTHLTSPPPQPQMRRNSVSSKKSQKSSKSAKSAKSFKSARRHYNKQQKQHQPKEKPKYIPRSYDEMMRIPDIYERVSFYDKTLDLCLKAESPITQWSKTNQLKGKPQALIDGYEKNILSSSNVFSPSDYTPMTGRNTSTTFGSSISLFLKKATSNNTSTQSFQSMQQAKYSPQISHSLFGRSMSRFQLSRSTQLPHKHQDHHRTSLLNNNTNRISHVKKSTLSPLSTLPPIIQASASTPTKVQDGLSYMMNVLPQIDIKILQLALEEAKGDPMVAITIAVSKNKTSSMALDHLPRKKKTFRKMK